MGVYFNGRYYIKPQVATFVNDTALTPVGLVGSNVIGMLGPAKDGIPNQAYLLTSLNDATDIFGEGPLVDGVAMAFAGGAQYIWATRVGGTYDGATHLFTNPPVQAVYSTTDGAGIPFALLSNARGAHANGIQITTATSTSPRGIDVTVAAQGNTLLAQGIYYDALTIENSGSVTTFAVTTGTGNLVVTQGANSGTVALSTIATTTDLVESIKSAMVNASPAAIDTSTFTFTVMKELPGSALDIQSESAETGTNAILHANVKAVFDWFNSGSQPFIYAEDEDAIFTTAALDKDLTLLAAGTFNMGDASVQGSIGTIAASSYTGALAEIYEDLDLDLIVPIVDDYLGLSITSSAPAIFTAVLNHCKMMSTTGSEERVGLVGYQFTGIGSTTATSDGDADTLKDALIASATSFNSPYLVVCAPRLKTFDIKGNLKFFNGTYTAAYIAGLIAVFPVGEPITNKTLSGLQGLSTYFKNRQILELIDNGVLTIERVGSALKVVQGVTSWISDDNYNKKELSVRLATNYVAKNCRDNLKQFIGRKNSPQILSIIKGSLLQVLRELENEEIIVGTTAYPAYRNLTLTASGDVVRVTFECSPVLPINYILVDIHATVFQATI